MRHSTLLTILTASALLGGHAAVAQDAAPAATEATATPKLQTLEERFGYAYGYQIAKQLKRSGINIDLEKFNQAVNDALADKESAMSDGEVQAAFSEAQKVAEAAKAKAGQLFLDENGKKEGITTLPSGLQYQVIKEGEGAKPVATDTVKVHYRGTLVDGSEFDSSYSRNEPASFPLNRVIPGWTEGVQLMSKGAKYRFFVPYDLGYGDQGSPPDIPPYSTLIFDIELLDIGQ